MHAGMNVLQVNDDGSLRPGRLLSKGKCPRIIDASEAVAWAPVNEACRGMQQFTPQWKCANNNKNRYHKHLEERYMEGSLRSVTALGRKVAPQVIHDVVPRRFR